MRNTLPPTTAQATLIEAKAESTELAAQLQQAQHAVAHTPGGVPSAAPPLSPLPVMPSQRRYSALDVGRRFSVTPASPGSTPPRVPTPLGERFANVVASAKEAFLLDAGKRPEEARTYTEEECRTKMRVLATEMQTWQRRLEAVLPGGAGHHHHQQQQQQQ